MTGWIKLHRSLRHDPIFQNESLLKAWIWCLCKASHQEHEQMVGNQFIKLKEGQFITGRNAAGDDLGLSPSTAWNRLKTLENNKSIKIISESKFSIVEIINWEEYQKADSKLTGSNNDTDNVVGNKKEKIEQQVDSKLTADEQQVDTNKNVKNIKNDKNIDKYIYSASEKNLFDDQNLKDISRLYESNLGAIGSVIAKDLIEISKTFKADMFEEAIAIAARRGTDKFNFNYVRGILKQWEANEILTLDDLEALRDRESKKKEVANNKKDTKKNYISTGYKNRFHNFEQRTDGFSEDAMEAMAKRKRDEVYKKIDKEEGSSTGKVLEFIKNQKKLG